MNYVACHVAIRYQDWLGSSNFSSLNLLLYISTRPSLGIYLPCWWHFFLTQILSQCDQIEHIQILVIEDSASILSRHHMLSCWTTFYTINAGLYLYNNVQHHHDYKLSSLPPGVTPSKYRSEKPVSHSLYSVVEPNSCQSNRSSQSSVRQELISHDFTFGNLTDFIIWFKLTSSKRKPSIFLPIMIVMKNAQKLL